MLSLMGRRLRENDTTISHVQYICRTFNIYIGRPISVIRCPISISDVRYLYRTSNIQYPTTASARARARATARSRARSRTRARTRSRARARARAGISDVGHRYRTSDIDIGRRI